MIKSILLLITLLSSTTAFAAGGTYCSVDNGEILIEVNLVNSRMPGSPVAQGRVDVSIKEHLSTAWTFDGVDDQVAWWDSQTELKLSYSKELAEENSQLIVEVQKVEETGEAFGVYRFFQNNKLASSGAISCSYE